MEELILKFEEINCTFPLVFVEGTGEHRFPFGLENDRIKIQMGDFYISRYPVTQVLWEHITGTNPACSVDENKPVENVSFHDITEPGGFLQKLQAKVKDQLIGKFSNTRLVQFRLPTETEWEFAARGGIYCRDYFIYSGSDNIDEVGWYKRNSGNETKPVGQKKPNQLGLYDMSGNVWEWCQDYYQDDSVKIPVDGSPCLEESPGRVLRGGCFHNFGIHCTVMKRYQIEPQYKDGCIGFRVVLAI